MKHIGRTIKAVVEAKKLQKNHVASQVGISPTYMSAIMRKPTIDCALLDRICTAIDVQPGFFFDDIDFEPMNEGAACIPANSLSRGEAAALQKLIEEKERTIQILMKAKGFSED